MRRLAAPLLSIALLTVGCSGFDNTRGRGDAPVGKADDSPSELINFPDKFANVAHKCDGHGHRVYSTTRTGAPPVVVDDPSCGGPAR